MPIVSRPTSLARKTPAARARSERRPSLRARLTLLRRGVVRALLVLLLLPPLVLVAYRFVPVPITPLMVIRLVEGEGLSRSWVPLEAIAPALREAVVAAEDNLFCQHWGFDLPALEGELAALREGRRARGASTITMQTAKNLFLWPDRSLTRKVLEAWFTPQIELLWPKRRILEVYLNIAELGPGIYGAEAAARAYFGKPAADLSPREAALLAAVLPSPRQWSPTRPTDFLNRRVQTIHTRINQLGPLLDCVREPG